MNFAPMRELQTEHLSLRRLRFEDVYDYYERIGSDGEVTKYMLFEPHQDIGESLQSIEKTLERYEEGGCYRWAIALKEEDELIGVMELLRHENIDPAGKECVVVGRSNIVGKPMGMLLLHANGTVTIAHSRTKNLADVTRRADILVVAVGKAGFITGENICIDGGQTKLMIYHNDHGWQYQP